MFSSPTAIRVLKKQDPAFMKQHDLSSLRYLFLAGEPLDEPTARWVSEALGGVAIVDNYWQTETRLADPVRAAGHRGHAAQVRQPVVSRAAATTCGSCDEATGAEVGADEKGVLAIVPPLPPGCMTTDLGRRRALRRHLLPDVPRRARLLDLRLGDARRRRLLLRARAAPTT